MRILPLNYNVSLLSKYYELNTSRVNQSAYASIDNVTGTTGANVQGTDNVSGNQPMRIDPSLALDMKEVYNAIANPDARVKLLMLLNKPDLMNLLFLLDKDKLILGLNFFSAAKLLQMITSLPKELLVQVLLMYMDQDTLVKLLPQKELLRILNSGKINESMLVKSIKDLPTHILIQMLESIFGESMGGLNHMQVVQKLNMLKKRQLLEGILTLPRGNLQRIVLGFTKQDASLFCEASRGALTQPMSRFSKSMLVNSFSVLDTSDIVKILGHLPKELLAQVACMIDPGQLAQVLCNEFPQLLASLAA